MEQKSHLKILVFGMIAALVCVMVYDQMQSFPKAASAQETPVGKALSQDGRYREYSQQALNEATKNGRVLLYFWAPWCSSCKDLDIDLNKKMDQLPADITILRVPFDTASGLKVKYGVVKQQTFIQLDKNGNQQTIWVGGDIETIKNNLLPAS